MNMRTLVWTVVVLAVLIGGWYLFDGRYRGLGARSPEARILSPTGASSTPSASASSRSDSMGTYSYECDERVRFTMTPSSDMGSIAIAPNGASATYPPKTTLYREPAPSGVRYVGNGILFTAHGETVTLGQDDSKINCSPLPNPDLAPFHFGD